MNNYDVRVFLCPVGALEVNLIPTTTVRAATLNDASVRAYKMLCESGQDVTQDGIRVDVYPADAALGYRYGIDRIDAVGPNTIAMFDVPLPQTPEG